MLPSIFLPDPATPEGAGWPADMGFVAIDSDTNEICEGYPLPNPEIDITYDESGKHATDLYGRKYDVIDLSERRKANEERFNAS